MIEIYGLFLFTYFVGFIAGYYASKQNDIKEPLQKASQNAQFITYNGKKVLRETLKPSIPTGQIKPPTAQEAYERSLPKEKREGIEEMRATLDMSPELQKQKELVKRLREQGVDPYA